MAYSAHRLSSETIRARCAVITLSDTRTLTTDTSGQSIQKLLSDAGHDIVEYQILPDDPNQLNNLLGQLLNRDDIDAILTNGGTGISRRDHTISAIEKLLDQTLPGFGELFRMLSWQQIASGAMLSRAIGGISKGKLIFAMPGSTNAVLLAMEKLILPELKHLVYELRK